MKNVREKIKMMSANQIAVYHTLLETFNVISHLSTEQIYMKWTVIEKKYALKSTTNKDLKVQEKPKLICMVLHTIEQNYSACYYLKLGKPKTQMPSKLCQKIGYGKTFLHINHFHFLLLLSFNKSVKVLWIIAKYTTINGLFSINNR